MLEKQLLIVKQTLKARIRKSEVKEKTTKKLI